MKHIIRKYSKPAIVIAVILVLITLLVNRYQYKEDLKSIQNHQLGDQQLPADDIAEELAEGT